MSSSTRKNYDTYLWTVINRLNEDGEDVECVKDIKNMECTLCHVIVGTYKPSRAIDHLRRKCSPKTDELRQKLATVKAQLKVMLEETQNQRDLREAEFLGTVYCSTPNIMIRK